MAIQELIGVGVGPGDPELVTVKAVRVLREADLVLVPETDARGAGAGRAEAIVRAYVDAGRLARVSLVMAEPAGAAANRGTPGAAVPEGGHGVVAAHGTARDRSRAAAARAVLDAFDGGASRVAFATIGDPHVYASFTYVAEQVRALRPQVRVSAVPGITAMQDLAARSGTALCSGDEPLTLVPITAGLDAFTAAVAGPGTVVAYKGWRRLPEIVDVLRRQGRLDRAVLGRDLGLPGEAIVSLAAEAGGTLPAHASYLSAVLVPARSRAEEPR